MLNKVITVHIKEGLAFNIIANIVYDDTKGPKKRKPTKKADISKPKKVREQKIARIAKYIAVYLIDKRNGTSVEMPIMYFKDFSEYSLNIIDLMKIVSDVNASPFYYEKIFIMKLSSTIFNVSECATNVKWTSLEIFKHIDGKEIDIDITRDDFCNTINGLVNALRQMPMFLIKNKIRLFY